MPEGDTIFRAAETLNRVLAGRTVTRFESVFPALTRIAVDRPVVGRTIESVTSRGKHLLMRFSGDLVLHTHMRMNGSWHIYPAGVRWRRPAREMRILIETSDAQAVGFNIPVANLMTAGELARHRELARLGDDLLAGDFDREDARQRMRDRGAEPIADVLLNQRVVAGIGNVFKSEILFLARVFPFAPVASIDDGTLDAIIDVALKTLNANVADRSRTLAPTRGRRTTGSLHPAKALWVYGRGGEPCRRCGAVIRSRKTGIDARLTYWCPACQADPSPFDRT